MGDEKSDLGIGGSIEKSTNSVDDTAIVIRSEEEEEDAPCVSAENGDSNSTANVLRSGKESIKDLKDEKHSDSYVIDVKSGGGGGGGGVSDGNGKLCENLDGDRVCRICHLSSDPSAGTPPRQSLPEPTVTITTTTTTTTTTIDLIQLGCGCKDELGIVHVHCAEAWFKLKGNRRCEICGETAKNITVVGDNRFIEEWNETIPAGNGSSLSERRGGCWRGQPFCNFLMACLVIAFVLPWFFRVNMF